MMTDEVTQAIYKMGYDTGDSQAKVEALTASVKGNTVALGEQASAEDRVVAKRALSSSSIDSLISKYSAEARAADQYAKVAQTVALAEQQGVGTAAQRATALELAAQKLGINTAATVENTKATTGWYNLWGLLPGQVANTSTAMNANAAAVRGLTAEHNLGSAATKDFREAVHGLHPVLEEAGVGVSGLTGFSSAARGGIVALAGAIAGALAASFEIASDKIRHLKADLAGLGGGDATGNAAFSGLKHAAEDGRVGLDALAGGYGQLLVAQQKFQQKQGVVFAPDAANAAVAQLDKVASSFASIGRIADVSDATIDKAMRTIATSFATSGKLTSQAFQQVIDASPAVAAAIAKAYNGQTLVQFMQTLDQGNVSYTKFMEVIGRSSATLQEQADKTVPGLTRAWNDLKAAAERYAEGNGSGGGIAGALSSLSKEFDEVTKGTKSWLGVLGDADMKLIQLKNDLVSWAAVGIIDGVSAAWGRLRTAMLNLPSIPAGSLSPSQMPIPTSGGLGGYGGPRDIASQAQGNAIGDLIANANVTNGVPDFFASGTDQVIPAGFDNDKFIAHVSSGERLIVVPKGQTLSDYLGGGKPINLGHFADGVNALVGPGATLSDMSGPRVDAASTQQGNALIDAVDSQTDFLRKVGITLDATRQVITGAGNDKIPDVIRVGTIQTITAIGSSNDAITKQIAASGADTVSAISALSSSISASMEAQSSAASSASSGSFSAAGASAGPGPYGSLPGSVFINGQYLRGGPASAPTGGGGGGSKDTTPPPSGNMALWNQIYGKDYNPDGSIKGSNSLVSPSGTYLGAGSSGSQGAYAPKSAASTPGSTGNDSSPQASFIKAPGISATDVYGHDASGDVVLGAPTTSWTDSVPSQDASWAQGVNDFVVPPSFPNDTFIAGLSSGERVTVTPPGQSMKTSQSSSGKTIIIQAPITIQVASMADVGLAKAQVADKIAKQVAYSFASA